MIQIEAKRCAYVAPNSQGLFKEIPIVVSDAVEIVTQHAHSCVEAKRLHNGELVPHCIQRLVELFYQQLRLIRNYLVLPIRRNFVSRENF